MPRITVAAGNEFRRRREEAIKASEPHDYRSSINENNSGTASEASSVHSTDELKVLLYNINKGTFREAPRSHCIRQDLETNPLVQLSMSNPPLLVDGRMYNIDIPRWTRRLWFTYRSVISGHESIVKKRVVYLPWRYWYQRNFKGMWGTLFIERAWDEENRDREEQDDD